MTRKRLPQYLRWVGSVLALGVCSAAASAPDLRSITLRPAVPYSPRAQKGDGFGAEASGPLAGLAAEDRKNVVLLDGDGVVYASSPDLTLELQTPTAMGGNLMRSDEGHLFAAPALPPPGLRARGGDLYGISKDRKTGPYHGVYAKPGYAYEEAIVHLSSSTLMPPDIEVDTARQEDTPFVYMGGEGAHGGAVDAGFQYSPTHDNWSLFVAAEGFGYIGDPGTRFKSDQDVRLKFYVPSDDHIAVVAEGMDVDGNPIARTLVLDMTDYPTTGHAPAGRAGQPTRFGWSAHGGGNVLKRLTSIAQKTQAFDTHSYTRGIRWSNVKVGMSPTENHPWGQADVGETFNWPDAQHIVVRRRAPDDETVGIQLSR
jgi:hypothetical protein